VVGFQEIAKLAHRAEDLLDLLYEDGLKLLPEHLQLLFVSTEALENLLNQRADGVQLQQLYETYDELLSKASATAAESTANPEQPAPKPRTTKPLFSTLPEVDTEFVPEGESVATPLLNRGKDVRVPIERLDAVVKLVTELLVNQAAFEQNMKRLQRQLEEIHDNSLRLSRVATKMEVQFEASTLGGRQAPQVAGAGNWLNGTPGMGSANGSGLGLGQVMEGLRKRPRH
jgi:chemotaxis protein histidine kinase CheA